MHIRCSKTSYVTILAWKSGPLYRFCISYYFVFSCNCNSHIILPSWNFDIQGGGLILFCWFELIILFFFFFSLRLTIGKKVNEAKRALHSQSIIPSIAISCSCQSIVFQPPSILSTDPVYFCLTRNLHLHLQMASSIFNHSM